MPKKKVFIVDDHPVFRQGLRFVIEGENDLMVCGEAGSAQEVFAVIVDDLPDLVTVDLSLKTTNGIDLVGDLKKRYPNLKTLVISMWDEDLYAERALAAGARGYVSKNNSNDDILLAMRQVLSGKIYMTEKLKERLLVSRYSGQKGKNAIQKLNNRELQVFSLLGEGFTTQKIAEKMSLSRNTVDTYRSNIKDKLNIENANQLVVQAVIWRQNAENSEDCDDTSSE